MTDVNQEEGVEAVRDSEGYLVEKDTLTFTTPDNSVFEGAKAGEQTEHEFEYRVVENDDQANAIIKSEGWNLIDLVNRKLKADKRAATYQRELNKHKPVTTTKTPEQLREQLVKTFILLGMSPDEARRRAEQ